MHEPNTPPSIAQTVDHSEGPKITIEHHPNSGRASETRLPDEHSSKRQCLPPPDAEPWRPFFKTREDFMLAELLLEVGMTKDQTDRLVKLIKRCLDGKGSLSFSNSSDIQGAWERASTQLTPVSPESDQSYSVYLFKV